MQRTSQRQRPRCAACSINPNSQSRPKKHGITTRVIPTGNTRKLEVDAAEFAKAVDRVATVSSERSRAVKLALDEDRLVLSVNAPDSGAAEEELAVAYGDERLEIGFNAKYLLEIASQVDRENAVFMFNSSGDPTLMREGNDTSAIYVVMPMRV